MLVRIWWLLFGALLLPAFAAYAQNLSVVPAAPGPLDTVRLQYAHVGCTNPDSITVAQQANHITVQVDRAFVVDCGTVQGYTETFTLGRLPSGNYDVSLVVNPPPGTLGPSQLLGPLTFSVAPLPATGSARPHENYTDMWWNPRESGWALNLYQSGDTLVGVWAVYDASNRPTWYAMLSGSWMRDANNVLRYAGTVYQTSGPFWAAPFDPAALGVRPAGTAQFVPTATTRAQFSFDVDGVTGSKTVERFRL